MRPISVAFVVAYGELRDSFFADTLLAMLCAATRRAGHRAEMVRVYYDGRDPAVDAHDPGVWRHARDEPRRQQRGEQLGGGRVQRARHGIGAVGHPATAHRMPGGVKPRAPGACASAAAANGVVAGQGI